MPDISTQLEWASPQQEELFKRGPYPTLASGGYGSGKTTIALLKLLYLMDTFPNYRVAIVRRRYNELWKTTLATLFKLLPPNSWVKRNDQSGELVLRNGSRFDFIYLEKADTASVLRGLELNGALVDQCEEAEESTVDLLEDRLGRWDKAEIPASMIHSYEAQGREWPWRTKAGKLLPPSYLLLTCNPDNELHWLWRKFHPDSAEWREKWRLRGNKLINFDSRDNKFLSQQNLETMMSRDEDFVRRYVRGEWGRPEGQLFDVSPLSILESTPDLLNRIKDCAKYRVLDHGYTAPTCCLWFAVDQAGNSFCYREYYFASDQVRLHREAITAMSGDETYRASMADSEIFNMMPMKGGGRYSVASEYTDCTIYPKETAIWWSRVDKAEMASRLRLKEYLWVDPKHKHPITGELGAPRLYFVTRTDDYRNGCAHAISELKGAKLTKIATVNGKAVFSDDRDPAIPDHALDPTRYFVMSRPTIAATQQKVASICTFDGYSKFSKAERRRQSALRGLDK